MSSTDAFRRARDFLQLHREDYETAYREFRWPVLDRFNWAIDWFDVLAEGNTRTALHIVEDDGSELKLSYRRAGRALEPGGGLLPAAGRRARRPRAHDARELGPDLGGDAGRHEGRGGDHPCHVAPHPGGPARPLRSRRRCSTSSPIRSAPRSCARSTVGTGRSWSGRGCRAGRPTSRPTPSRRSSSRRPTPTPTTRCCSTSPRVRPPSRSSSCTRRRAIRSATSPPCTGSAWCRATST